MSFTVLRDKFVQHHRAAKAERDYSRALSSAPTEASRQELLGLQRAYNNL